MKKILFAAAVLAFAGVTTISASNHQVNVNSRVLQDTTDTTTVPTDTTSVPTDTTGIAVK